MTMLGISNGGSVPLSDAVARRYFLQGAEPLRAAGIVLA
jgi:hypothetical protein